LAAIRRSLYDSWSEGKSNKHHERTVFGLLKAFPLPVLNFAL